MDTAKKLPTWIYRKTVKDEDNGSGFRIIEEEAELENWIWGVLYDDGTELHQFDDDGLFHRIDEIDESRVKLWTLYQPAGMGDGRIDIAFPEGANVVHKYKRFCFNAGTPQEYRRTAYCFGYRLRGHTHYNYVLPDGRIIQSVNQEAKLTDFGLC